MKRAAIVVALVVALAVIVDQLGDLTQSRPDHVRNDTATEIVLAVDEDRFAPGQDAAAAALWGVCAAQTRSHVADALAPTGDGRYRVVLEPAVGDHERRKLVGCLEDLTIDRVLGDVESFRTVAGRQRLLNSSSREPGRTTGRSPVGTSSGSPVKAA